MNSGRHPALGIALIVGSAACFATMDTLTRYLGALMPVQLVLWVRYALHAIVMAIWLAFTAGTGFRTAHMGFQVLRGMLLLASSTLVFYGLQHLPVAEFTAIIMLTPVLVTLLAAWALHDRVSRLRWALVFGGFAGALIVVRPGSGLFGWAVWLPLAAAFTNAFFQIITSKLGSGENALTTNFYTGFTGTVILTPVLLTSAVDVPALLAAAPALQWIVLIAIGALGTTGHLLLIMSLSIARASTLMPFLYTQIGFAALVGWWVFRAVPDAWGWIGMAVIAACGAASAWLNVRSTPKVMSALAIDTMLD